MLDSVTLLRFAHVFREPTAGGLERYLLDLNRALLERNRMRVIQVYLVKDPSEAAIETERVGKGEILWVPSVLNGASEQIENHKRPWMARWRRTPLVAHDTLLSTLASHRVDVAAFHWVSEDSEPIMQRLQASGVPIAVINHFENDRLERSMIRKQLRGAVAIAGVSSVNVPASLSGRFTNLSDGIDLDYFQPENAGPFTADVPRPILLLPARLAEGKGHVDAVVALGWLRRAGIPATLVFAGRGSGGSCLTQIENAIVSESVQGQVVTLGELSVAELRDLYYASDIVILPSHSEGLGRVLLEAQAMERPVIAYDVGGVSEAVSHGSTGFLVPKGDTTALAQRIAQLLRDGSTRETMGKEARTHVRTNFSLEALAARHEAFYTTVLRRN